MINSINTIEKKQNNIFSDVKNNTSGVPYWILSKKNNDEFIPEKYRKYKVARIIGESIVAVAIVTTAGILFAINGGPRAIVKHAQKLSQNIDKKIQAAKLQNEKVSIFQLILRKAANIIGSKFEAVNNFNTIKDYSLKQILYKKNGEAKGFLAKGHLEITNLFERIAQKTVLNKYKKTGKKFKQLKPDIDRVLNNVKTENLSKTFEINGTTKTKKEWLELLNNQNDELENLYKTDFSKITILRRFIKFKNSASEAIKQYFGSRGFFWFLSKETLNSFAAQNAVETQRNIYRHNLNQSRNNIYYSINNLAQNASDMILKITQGISNKDNKRFVELITLEKDLKILSRMQNSKDTDVVRKEIIQKLNNFLNNIKDDKKISKKTINNVANLKSMFENYKEGKIQQILNIYRQILTPEEFAKIEKIYEKRVSSLDKSINTETEDFTGKIRDLLLGSAPTDIISIFGGLVTLGYFLTKSEDNNKRISVSLKYGVPALTGLGTTMYGNAKLFAGSKSLLLGIASWFVTGKITNYLNNKFLAHIEKKNLVKNQ